MTVFFCMVLTSSRYVVVGNRISACSYLDVVDFVWNPMPGTVMFTFTGSRDGVDIIITGGYPGPHGVGILKINSSPTVPDESK